MNVCDRFVKVGTLLIVTTNDSNATCSPYSYEIGFTKMALSSEMLTDLCKVEDPLVTLIDPCLLSTI